MNEFIHNILNPPETKAKGQIWYSKSADLDFLITGVIFEGEEKIFQVVALTKIIEANDGNDVLITEKFLPTERLALRFSRGPILERELNYYKGSVDHEIFSAVKRSFKNRDRTKYNETQWETIPDILERLEKLRAEALRYYENHDPVRVPVILFHLPELPVEEDLPYIMPAAAAGITEVRKKQEFWDALDSAENESVIEESGDLLIKLNSIKNHIYLSVFSEKYKKISNIRLISGEKVVEAYTPEMSLSEENRAVTSFEREKITKGSWNLIFSIDEIDFKYQIKME